MYTRVFSSLRMISCILFCVYLCVVAGAALPSSSFTTSSSSTTTPTPPPTPPLSASLYIVPPALDLQSPNYGEWAHSHWVWLSAEVSNQTSVLEFVNDWHVHNISIGAVDIDSSWPKTWNDFIINKERYPDMKQLIQSIKATHNIRVIFWITSMIDIDSTYWNYSVANNYLIKNGFGEPGVMKWWHGHGGLLDYTNAEAVNWWHSLMDPIFDLGISGWKTDGTDPFIVTLINPLTSDNKPITYRQYADLYYGDFFNYTRAKVGAMEGLIMNRPVDVVGEIFWEYSPKYTMASGWVGDADGTWQGLQDDAKRIMQSAWRGYANMGPDIFGYRSKSQRSKELLLRWTQYATFLPLMENGGDDDHKPWDYEDPSAPTQTTDIYRQCVDVHTALAPYLWNYGAVALQTSTAVLTPLEPVSLNQTIETLWNPGTYAYLLGPNILVNPVMNLGQTTLNVTFPALPNTQQVWSDFYNSGKSYQQNTNIPDFPLDISHIPVFIASGSVIPLKVCSTVEKENVNQSIATAFKWSMYQLPQACAGLTLLIEKPLIETNSVTEDAAPTMVQHVRRGPEEGSFTVSYRTTTVNSTTSTISTAFELMTTATQLPLMYTLKQVALNKDDENSIINSSVYYQDINPADNALTWSEMKIYTITQWKEYYQTMSSQDETFVANELMSMDNVAVYDDESNILYLTVPNTHLGARIQIHGITSL